MAEIKQEVKEFRALIEAVDAGKPGASKDLHEFVRRNDWALRLGDLSILAMDSCIAKLIDNPASRELLAAQVNERKRQMGYEDASGIERMMIERVAMCWLRVLAEESRVNNTYGDGASIKVSEFASRSLSRAQSRFLQACESLERYRILSQATRIATARADLIKAKAGEARMNGSNAAMRLLKSVTG